MNTMKHSLSSHKICTPMTMSISNRLCMHDLYLVKLQTYLLLIFVITNIISSDNHYFFEFVFLLFLQVTSFLIDLNKTFSMDFDSYFNKIFILLKMHSVFQMIDEFSKTQFQKIQKFVGKDTIFKKWSTRLITSPLRAHTE